ncbi:MAG: hypothetical protein EBU08_14610, partial [Micrococcales bacterium]|nr:hypothetical protein [Micrococcales bacterium]
MEFKERLVALAANKEISDSMIADFLYSVEDALFFQEDDIDRAARSLGINVPRTFLDSEGVWSGTYQTKDALRIINKMIYEEYIFMSNKTEKYKQYSIAAGDLWEELESSSDPSDPYKIVT